MSVRNGRIAPCEAKQSEYCGGTSVIGCGGPPLSSCRYLFHQKNLLAGIDLLQFYFDDLVLRGLHRTPDEGGFDGQFTMSAVDQNQQLHSARTSVIEQCVERGANCASSVQNVVHKNDVLVGYVEADLHLVHHWLRTSGREIVTVKINVEGAYVNGRLLNLAYESRQSLCQGNTAPLDSDKAEALDSVVFLDDLVRETNEGALDLGRRHQTRFFAQDDLWFCALGSHDWRGRAD